MATSRLIAIKSIEKKTKLRSINVRILRKWDQLERYGKRGIEMILVDEEGSKIQASVPSSLLPTMKDMFEEGKVLNISNFGVDKNILQNQKAKINHEWKLSMTLATTVSDVDTNVIISDNSFVFTSFKCFGNDSTINAEFVVDVIGEVVLPLRDFDYVTKMCARKLDVRLTDNEGLELSCVLWESCGDEIKQFIDKRGGDAEGPVILILQFVMVSRYQGKTRVGTMKHESKMHINPSFPEVKEFLTNRETGFPSNSPTVTTITNDSKNVNNSEWLKIGEVKTIVDLLKCKEVAIYTTTATIIDVDPHAKWYYEACINLKCNKGFDKSMKSCPKCGTPYDNIVPRFKIRIVVFDANDTNEPEAHFMLFDNCASSLLNMSAAEVLAEVVESMDGA